MLKTDTTSRYNSYAVGITNGFLSVDEVRDRENLEAMDYEEGDNDDELDTTAEAIEEIEDAE
jgi:hypothetical protein